MLKRVSTVILSGGAAILAIGLVATPALASTTLTVKVSSGGSYTATAPKTVLSDGGVNVTCTTKSKKDASVGSGSILSGTHKGTPPVKAGTVTKLAFNNCTGPLGSVKTKIESTPYSVSADSATNSKGQTDAIISGTKIAVTTGACSFLVTGSAPGYYTNSKHTLTMSSKLPVKALSKAQLTISKVNTGCLGVIKNGQHPTFSTTYTLSRKIVIKATS